MAQAGDSAPNAGANKHDAFQALLSVKKGSRFIPLLLLVLASLAFIVHVLGSNSSRDALSKRFEAACSNVRIAARDVVRGQDPGATHSVKTRAEAAKKQLEGRAFTPLANECTVPECREPATLAKEFRDTMSMVAENELQNFNYQEIGGWEGFVVVLSAAIKEWLDLLGSAFLQHWKSALYLTATASAYALLPGVAGLIYRRSFWTWFGIAFVALLAINSVSASLSRLIASKLDGPREADIVDVAADLTVVLLVQIAVLLLAFRLRRQSTTPPLITKFMAPAMVNRLLFWLLALVGVGTVIDVLGSKRMWGSVWAWSPLPDYIDWLNFLVLGLPFIYALLKVTETWAGRRRKNIVICLDGTSNTPDQLDMGLLAQTNVFKLFNCLKCGKEGSFAPTGRFDATLCKIFEDRQVAFYYTGIGNKFDNDPLIGTLSMATGLGASGIIERAYLDLIRVWRPGDRGFIFGFSRGAASARILARTIDQRAELDLDAAVARSPLDDHAVAPQASDYDRRARLLGYRGLVRDRQDDRRHKLAAAQPAARPVGAGQVGAGLSRRRARRGAPGVRADADGAGSDHARAHRRGVVRGRTCRRRRGVGDRPAVGRRARLHTGARFERLLPGRLPSSRG